MLTANNPIHRLLEIEKREIELSMLLAPAYLAIELLHHDVEDAENVDVTIIEVHPKFAPLWKELNQLRTEKISVHMDLAIGWNENNGYRR